MENEEINRQLKLNIKKFKLEKKFNTYLKNKIKNNNFNNLHLYIDLLQKKYNDDNNSIEFLNNYLRNYINGILSNTNNISSISLNNCLNENLLNDLLNFFYINN